MTVTTTKIPEKTQRTWTCDWCNADEVTVDSLPRPTGWFAIRLQKNSTYQGDWRHMCPECGRKRLARS